MKKEKESLKEAFGRMTLKEKAEYIFTYYKLPLFTAAVVLLVLGATAVRELTKKEQVLYLACINLSIGDDLYGTLTDGFIESLERDPKQYGVTVYRELYISEDASQENHEYAYASKMKILGAISAKKMDVALMNREAYDLMSQSGFLKDLSAEDAEWLSRIQPFAETNEVIVEDNAIEYRLNEADEYVYQSEEVLNGVNVTSAPIFRNAGMDGEVFLGIIANAQRPRGSAAFVTYLLDQH
ncbi:MAG: hypothetical protein IKS32_07155 [Solobacterium sp.]|nr:hypothetical protein [Solobacterium sp.]